MTQALSRWPTPCRPGKRLLKTLDITGARWGLQGAEAVLTLRAVISNGDFDDYWRFHLAREHQRLYPGTPQSQSLRVALPLTPNEPHPTAKTSSSQRNQLTGKSRTQRRLARWGLGPAKRRPRLTRAAGPAMPVPLC